MNRIVSVIMILAFLMASFGCSTALPTEPDEVETTRSTPELVVLSVPKETDTPTPKPTAEPTADPTAEPTPEPTDTPVPDYYPTDAPKKDGIYKVMVFTGTQSVVVYHSENGNWKEYKQMICSTGKKTPTGTFTVGSKYRYHKLFGARGQYCSRITGHILFHSVPIDEKAGSVEDGMKSMKLEEYEKLGTPASDGCIRLTCADAKWVYDNCDKSTVVIITKANGPEPMKPPALIAGEPYETSHGLGWDPTDPDPSNPYLTAGNALEEITEEDSYGN